MFICCLFLKKKSDVLVSLKDAFLGSIFDLQTSILFPPSVCPQRKKPGQNGYPSGFDDRDVIHVEVGGGHPDPPPIFCRGSGRSSKPGYPHFFVNDCLVQRPFGQIFSTLHIPRLRGCPPPRGGSHEVPAGYTAGCTREGGGHPLRPFCLPPIPPPSLG